MPWDEEPERRLTKDQGKNRQRALLASARQRAKRARDAAKDYAMFSPQSPQPPPPVQSPPKTPQPSSVLANANSFQSPLPLLLPSLSDLVAMDMTMKEYLGSVEKIMKLQALGSVVRGNETGFSVNGAVVDELKRLQDEKVAPPLQLAASGSRKSNGFSLDGWHASSEADYRSLWDGWVRKLQESTSTGLQFEHLYLRFLSYSVLECEEYLGVVEENGSRSLEFLVGYAREKTWLSVETGFTGEALKKLIKNTYFPSFEEGSCVLYRKLDSATFVGYDRAIVVGVESGCAGFYTIRFENGSMKSTPAFRFDRARHEDDAARHEDFA